MTLNLAPAGPIADNRHELRAATKPRPLLIAESERIADGHRLLIAPNAESGAQPSIDASADDE
jgi:hypothetical protein